MTSPQTVDSSCLDAFLKCMGGDAEVLVKRSGKLTPGATRASIHNVQKQVSLGLPDIPHLSKSQEPAVLVVENVDLHWIARLAASLQIDPSFFAAHASVLSGATPWRAIFGTWSHEHKRPVRRDLPQSDPPGQASIQANLMQSWHLEGVIEYEQYLPKSRKPSTLRDPNYLPRILHHDKDYGWSCSTRISYIRARPDLYLFLVDAPMVPTSLAGEALSSRVSTLRLPLGLNRGGLGIPQIFGQPQFSLHDCLHGFLSHPWHLKVMFAGQATTAIHFSPETLLHLLASSIWAQNLRTLRREIEIISFEDIRRPSIAINDKLHDQRHDLVYLTSSLAMTIKWLPSAVRTELNAIRDDIPEVYIGYPDATLQETSNDAIALERFLMDTFNLLLSSVGVLEAENSTAQAHRGQTLTMLALIYVPLSFVTGIYGMNVGEINGSPLSVWVVVPTLVVTLLCTFFGLASLKWWRQHRPFTSWR